MKRKLLLLSLFLFALTANAQIVNIPDANFKNELLQSTTGNYGIASDAAGNTIVVDINNDGEIQQSEADNIYRIRVLADGIASLEGITSFTNLEHLTCGQNYVAEIDFSGLTNLNEIVLYSNPYLSSLNFTGLSNLEKISLSNSNITNLDLSPCTALSNLNIQWCPLGTLDLSALTSLEQLMLYNDQLTSIDLSTLSNLTSLGIGSNLLTSLDVSNNLQLKNLHCSNNDITSITVANSNSIESIGFDENNVSSFDFSLCPNLEFISCSNNLITSVDLSNLPLLESFSCRNNQINEFDFSENPLLTSVDIAYTDVTMLDLRYQQVTELSLTGCADLEALLILNDSYDFGGESEYNLEGLDSLNSVCSDEEEEDTVEILFSGLGYSDIVYSTDCELPAAAVEEVVLNELTVYPNPANDVIQLKSGDLISAVSLYDMQGRMLINKSVNDYTDSIEFSQYPSGIYFLEVTSGKAKSIKKIVKN